MVMAVLSLVWFPYPYTVLLSIAASIYVPWFALGMGILADLLYLPAGMVPWASIGGLVLSALALFVHRFIKTRMIDA